ncbi:ankyrin repeat domain-containing protein [Spiroplasma endosymbiont of Polydrusus formosus]|uniref:ankyrin repeat domain-containing protein n=1 Tax=Spiroplasma endosymbiont of Polydrusus formosus TaxID=3139326 RepID=UPI0035B51636
MKKLLGLLGTIMITSNTAVPLVANKSNNNNDKIKNILEILNRKKRQNNENISTTPKTQDDQQSQFLATSNNQVEFIEKEITLNENYSDNIQIMLQELINENYIDPLRMINNEGIVRTDYFETNQNIKERNENIKIIEKLDEILELKKFDANKIRILVLTLKNKNDNKIKLVINLNNFYLLGIINNQNQYFYFDDELVEKVKQKNKEAIETLKNQIKEISNKNQLGNLNKKLKNLQGESLKIDEQKIKSLNTAVIKKYNCQKINLNYTGSYSENGLDVVIKEKGKPNRAKDIIISRDTLNNAIVNLEKINNESNQNQTTKNDLAKVIFITSEAMRFGSHIKYFNYEKNGKQVEFKNIPEDIQNIINSKNDDKIQWKNYSEQLIGGWIASSKYVEEKRKEIFKELRALLEYFEIHDYFLNNLKKELKLNKEILFSATNEIFKKIDEKNIDDIKIKIKNIWIANILSILKEAETTPFKNRDQILKIVLDKMRGLSPAHVTIKINNLDITKLLILRKKELINQPTNTGDTPLHFACNFIEDNKENGREFLNWAQQRGGDIENIDNILNNQPEIDNKKERENNYLLIKFLLENGADINARNNDGNTPLHNAAKNGYLNVVKLLLENGADINAINNDDPWVTPLDEAAINGNIAVVKFLLENKANIDILNRNQINSLHSSTINGHIAIVKLLLKYLLEQLEQRNITFDNLTKNILQTALIIKIDENKNHTKIKELLEKFNKFNKLKTKASKKAKEQYKQLIVKLLKIELSDIITETDLGKLSDNSPETILNRLRELNPNLDISQVKIQENSITDTAASIESIDKIYTDDTVKVTFTLGKKPSNINDTKKIITEDEYKKLGARPKGSQVISNQPYNTNNSNVSVSDSKKDKTIGTQGQNYNQREQNTMYDVPGEGSCLFWSVATAYLLPVRRNNDEKFKTRFIQLFGEENLKYLQPIQKLLKQYDLENNRNLNQLWYQDQIANNLVTTVFRNRVVDYIERNLDTISNHGSELTFRNLIQENNEIDVNYLERIRENNSWGDTPEIMAMSNLLNVNISVNNDSPYQPINQNSSNTINIFHVNGNHYNFDISHQISSTNSEIESINNNNKTQQDLTDAVTENKLDKISDNQEQTILNRARELNPNLNIDKINVTDIRSTTALIVSNDENIYSGCVIISFIIATQNNLENISSNQEHTIKESIINSQEKIATVISNQSAGGGTASVPVNKQISTNIVNSQTTVKKAINKYNSLSKKEKQQKLNEINNHYQTLSENDKKTFKDKLKMIGTQAFGAGTIGVGAKITVSSSAATGVNAASAAGTQAIEMTPLLSSGTTEGLATAETITVEASAATALSLETLGLSLVIAGLAISITGILWWINSDHTAAKHESHNQYNEIEKYYKFLAHDQLKLDININEWDKIKQIYQENSNNYQEFKNKIKSEITNFHKEDHSGWGGSISDDDIDTLINIIYNHFQEINNHFSYNHNHGWKIVTNTIGSYFMIEEE